MQRQRKPSVQFIAEAAFDPHARPGNRPPFIFRLPKRKHARASRKTSAMSKRADGSHKCRQKKYCSLDRTARGEGSVFCCSSHSREVHFTHAGRGRAWAPWKPAKRENPPSLRIHLLRESEYSHHTNCARGTYRLLLCMK